MVHTAPIVHRYGEEGTAEGIGHIRDGDGTRLGINRYSGKSYVRADAVG